MPGQLLGRTVVVASARYDATARAVVDALDAAGALVAAVAADRPDLADHGLAAAGDAVDPALWERLGPQIEQRLGPVDAVVVLAAAEGGDVMARAALAALGAAMAARRHGVVLSPSGLTVPGITGGVLLSEGRAPVLVAGDVIAGLSAG